MKCPQCNNPIPKGREIYYKTEKYCSTRCLSKVKQKEIEKTYKIPNHGVWHGVWLRKPSNKQKNTNKRRNRLKNIERMKCVVCGKKYLRNTKIIKGRHMGKGVRGFITVTCSHSCSIKLLRRRGINKKC